MPAAHPPESGLRWLAVRPGRLPRTSLVSITVAGLVGLFGGVSSSASIGPLPVLPSCVGLARSPVVYRAEGVVVYRAAVREDGGLHDWVCSSRPRSPLTAASALGTVSSGGFAPDVVVGHFISDGPWLVDLASSKRGWRMCFAANGPCRRKHHEMELTDVDGGGQTSTPSGAHVEIHLSVLPAHDGARTAAVVWTQPARGSLVALRSITARDRRGSGSSGLNPPVIGRINPRSVHLHGLKVSFIENGRHRAITLGV